jgi:two-component system response regulator YesN
MLKLIIADDEKWVRTTIKSIIPFGKLDIVLSSEASNGIEALELCRQHEPDILLTDIMMPGLNGLELISEIRKILPDIKMAVISGYNDFEYAKTAMKYGIMDYLLKPVDENELIQVLERISNEIHEREMLKREKETKQEQYEKALPVMCDSFLNELVSYNSMTLENIKNELAKYRINLEGNSFTLCLTAPDEVLKDNTFSNSYEYYRTIVKRTMRHYADAVTFPLQQNKNLLVSIVCGENAIHGVNKAFDICRRLLQKKSNLRVSCGVSGEAHTLCMIQKLFPEGMEALGTRFWKGQGTLTRYSTGCLSGDPKLALSEDTLNKIILNIKLSNLQTALSYIETVTNSLVMTNGEQKTKQKLDPAIPDYNPEPVKEFYWQFIQSIIIMLDIQLPFIRHESTISGEQPHDRIRDTIFMSDLDSYTKYLLQNVFDFYHDRNPVDSTNLIENAKKIIESNYSGDISLEQVARHVHLSPAYLSELFKKQTGMSFIDYKTIVRVENAKRLIMMPSMTISEVSVKVGYTDPKYFSKLFKKITGKTIFEYKKEAVKQGIPANPSDYS